MATQRQPGREKVEKMGERACRKQSLSAMMALLLGSPLFEGECLNEGCLWGYLFEPVHSMQGFKRNSGAYVPHRLGHPVLYLPVPR